MIRALYMMAASIAEAVCGQMHDVEHLQTRIKGGTSSARMTAKYFRSLAIENVVRLPRVMSSCLPIRTISMSLVGEEFQVHHVAGLRLAA